MIDPKTTTEVHEKLRRLLKNRDWLDKNLTEVQASYGDMWIAVAEERVVAQGQSSTEVKEQVEEKYPAEEMLILRVPKEKVSRPV